MTRFGSPIGAVLPLSVPGAYTWSGAVTAGSATLSVRGSCPGFIDSLYVCQVNPWAERAEKMFGRPTMLWDTVGPNRFGGNVQVEAKSELARPGWSLVGRNLSVGAF